MKTCWSTSGSIGTNETHVTTVATIFYLYVPSLIICSLSLSPPSFVSMATPSIASDSNEVEDPLGSRDLWGWLPSSPSPATPSESSNSFCVKSMNI